MLLGRLWEIALRLKPWPEIAFGSEFAIRYQRGERPPLPQNCPFSTLICRAWDASPAKRPSFVEIYGELEKLKSALLEQEPAGSAGSRNLSKSPRTTSNISFPSLNNSSGSLNNQRRSGTNLTHTQSTAVLSSSNNSLSGLPPDFKPNIIEQQIFRLFERTVSLFRLIWRFLIDNKIITPNGICTLRCSPTAYWLVC